MSWLCLVWWTLFWEEHIKNEKSLPWLIFLPITQNQFYCKEPHLVMLGHIYDSNYMFDIHGYTFTITMFLQYTILMMIQHDTSCIPTMAVTESSTTSYVNIPYTVLWSLFITSLCNVHIYVCPMPHWPMTMKPFFSSFSNTTRGGSRQVYSWLKI